MTAQFHDLFDYDGEEYQVVLADGEPLFHPSQVEICPEIACTGCWRGYVCKYKLHKNEFTLNQLNTWLSEEIYAQEYPKLNGVEVISQHFDYPVFSHIYENVGLNIPFSGRLLIGRDFIDDLYVHMGFQSAWKYKKVLELCFSSGKLVSERDLSKALSWLRFKLEKLNTAPEMENLDAATIQILKVKFEFDDNLIQKL